MRQLDIIKEINNYFKQNWTETIIKFDSPDTFKEERMIYVKYVGTGTEYQYLGDTSGRASIGILRIFVYDSNPTKCYELLDLVHSFISDKKINNVCITEDTILQSPERNENSQMYMAGISFDVSLLGY